MAGPNASFNMSNGNLVTHVALARRRTPRRGPPPQIVFFHNSLTAGDSADTSCPVGIGWRVSVSEELEILSATEAVLHEADGTIIEFTNGASEAGFFLDLEQVSASVWSITDRAQRSRTFEVLPGGQTGRLTEVVDAIGDKLVVNYANDLITSVVDATGKVLTFNYASQRLASIGDSTDPAFNDAHFWYDEDGHLTSVVDNHNAVVMEYDADDRVCAITGGNPSSTGLPARWQLSYHETGDWRDGRLERIESPVPQSNVGLVDYTRATTTQTTIFTDPRGQVWHYRFDASGRLDLVTSPLGATTAFTWNAQHRPTSSIDALGNTWTLAWDAAGNMTSSADPRGNTSTMTYDGLNNLISATDPVGNTTTQAFADAAFPTFVTRLTPPSVGRRGGGAIHHEYFHAPDPAAGLLRRTIDANGVETSYEYDADGRILAVVEGAGFPNRVRLEFDDLGLDLLPMHQYVPGAGLQVAGFPALPPDHPAVLGPLVRDAGALPAWTTELASTDVQVTPNLMPLGASAPEAVASYQETFEYDVLGRLVSLQRTDDQGTIDSAGSPVTRTFSYVYDDQALPGGTQTTVLETAPSGMTVSYRFDAEGRLEERSDSNGASIVYTYFATGLEQTATNFVAGVPIARTVRTYYTNGLLHTVDVETFDGTNWTKTAGLEYVHDARGLPVTIDESDGVGVTNTIVLLHDARGRLVREVCTGQGAGFDLAYGYDEMGNRRTKVARDPAGNKIAETDYDYDSDDPALHGGVSNSNRLVRARHLDGSGNLLATVWYGYDDAFGNVSEIVTIEAATPNVCRGVQLRYATSDDLLLKNALWLRIDREWELDENGQVVPGSVNYLGVQEIRQDGLTERYYSARRDPVTFARIETRFTDYAPSDDGGVVAGDHQVDSAGGVAELSDFDPGSLDHVSLPAALTTFHHRDLVGSIFATTSAGGASARRRYTAFGELVDESGTWTNRFGFQGATGAESLDETVGSAPSGVSFDLLRIGARCLDPGTGRWLQRDPIGRAGGPNGFVFVDNQPSLLIDRLGLTSSRFPPGTTFVPHDFVGPLTENQIALPPGWQLPKEPGGDPIPPPRYPNLMLPPKAGPSMGAPPTAPPPRRQNRASTFVEVLHVVTGVPMMAVGFSCHCYLHRDSGGAQPSGESRPTVRPSNPSAGRPAAGASPRKCFAARTLVATRDGLVPIVDLEPGDLVLSHDFETGATVESLVLARDRFDGLHEMVCLATCSGETIEVTSRHALRAEMEWRRACDLGTGTRCQTIAGSAEVEVDGPMRLASAPVYNLRVAAGNYHVGESGLLVSDRLDPAEPESKDQGSR